MKNIVSGDWYFLNKNMDNKIAEFSVTKIGLSNLGRK